jgi:hypothetical protein
VRCFAHIINLVCKEALKSVQKNLVTSNPKKEESLLAKLRFIIKYIADSPQRTYKFREIQDSEPLNLKLDTPTRWNSTFDMLDRAIILKESIQKFCNLVEYKNDLKNYNLNYNNSWKQIETLKEFLHVFKLVSTHISGEKYTTISSVLPFYSFLFSELRSWINNNPNFGNFLNQVNQAKSKLKDYFRKNGNCVSFACILDPRYNISYLESIEELSYDKVRISSDFNDELRSINPKSDTPIFKSVQQLNNFSTQTSLLDRFENVLKKRRVEMEPIEAELNRYFKVQEVLSIDPVSWWKVRYFLIIIIIINYLILNEIY